MRARITAILVTAALLVYLVVLGQLAVLLFGFGGPAGFGLGVAVVLLMVVGGWTAAANMWFGVRVERLSRQLARDGGLPDVSGLPVRPSGRVARAAADEFFEQRQAELNDEPADWRRWYRLAYAYDIAGDRRRARETMRQALRLSACAGGGGSPATSAGPGSVTRPAE